LTGSIYMGTRVIIDGDDQLIVLHEMPDGQQRQYSLASMLASEPLGTVVLDGLLSNSGCDTTYLAVPASWRLKAEDRRHFVVCYNGHIPLPKKDRWLQRKGFSYLVLSNGRFYTKLDYGWLKKAVTSFGVDVTLVNVEPGLSADQEKLQLTLRGQLAGVRRIYSNSVQRTQIPVTWPCHIFIHTSVVRDIFNDSTIPTNFRDFLNKVSKTASIASIKVAGIRLDIETPQGLLEFVAESLKSPQAGNSYRYRAAAAVSMDMMPESTRCYGEVVVGQNVRMGKDVRLVGPVVIGDGADIGNKAVVARSVISGRVAIAPREVVHDQLLVKGADDNIVQEFTRRALAGSFRVKNQFKIWPRLSYARFVKRAADIFVAAFVLILFAPVIAIIAFIVKATSRGPIFFGHLRQGLHGKSFHCFKFRSMIVGADELQQKLRIKNEVDGPQFKMDDDPRVTLIGKFLRDTYLDEIPQFFNVLMGNMSIVGPRPSPEAENLLCAYWRDARLSVRPGITGLWQVCRTRKIGSDFQEWVHYDSQYVRQISFKLDVWICWETTKYLVRTFLKQF
jgi:lipopolysaccharide/colanic/teichoic acid biosynthesis glycosyltransferase